MKDKSEEAQRAGVAPAKEGGRKIACEESQTAAHFQERFGQDQGRNAGDRGSSCQNDHRNGFVTLSHLLGTACGNHDLSRDVGVDPEGQRLGPSIN